MNRYEHSERFVHNPAGGQQPARIDARAGRATPRAWSLLIASAIVAVCAFTRVTTAQTTELEGPRWAFPSLLGPDAPDVIPADIDLIVDASERVHATWIGRVDSAIGDSLYTASRSTDGTWGMPVIIAGGDAVQRADPAIAIDASGALHIAVVAVGRDGAQIQHHMRRPSPNTAWSAGLLVSGFGSSRVESPAIAGDRLGNVHVAWAAEKHGGTDVLYRRRRSEGLWDEVMAVHDPLSGDQRSPDLGLTRDGSVWAVWEDSRNGRSEIWASVLPLASPVWWPDYPLTSSGTSGRANSPRVTGNGLGEVHAAWIESGGTRLVHASRPAGAETWQPPRTVHQPNRGNVLDVDIAGGSGGKVFLAWSETRSEGSRVYSGLLTDEHTLDRSRVDRVPRFGDGQAARIGVGSDALAHVVWVGRDVGKLRSLHATAGFDPPEREWVEARGRLRYEPLFSACHGARYVVEDCEGAVVRLVRPGGVELAPLLGRNVKVAGHLISDSPCDYVLVHRVELEIGDCRPIEGSITGLILRDGAPVEGATVKAGVLRARSGQNGRFFLDGLSPGTHALTATLPCALSSVAPAITVNPRQTVRMEPAHVRSGDVVEDCRIDIRDLTRLASHYRNRGETIGRCTDIDGDGVVGAADLAKVSDGQGTACLSDWRVEDPIWFEDDLLRPDVLEPLIRSLSPTVFGTDSD